MDRHYCPFCGDQDAFCGCPDDPNTSDKMHCPHCGGNWSRPHGDPSTTCLHRACRKEGSTVETPAKYAPTLPDKHLALLRAAEHGELTCSENGAWQLPFSTVTHGAKLLLQWGILRVGGQRAGRPLAEPTDHGRRILGAATERTDVGADTEPFEPDENDPAYGEDA